MSRTDLLAQSKRVVNAYEFHLGTYNIIALSYNITKYDTVDSWYLEPGYLEFCKTRSVYLDQNCFLIAFSNHSLTLETFLQVQITRSAS